MLNGRCSYVFWKNLEKYDILFLGLVEYGKNKINKTFL